MKYMGLPDTLIELEITPNRADLLSHLGVAREVAGLFNRDVRFPVSPKIPENTKAVGQGVKVSVRPPSFATSIAAASLKDSKWGLPLSGWPRP